METVDVATAVALGVAHWVGFLLWAVVGNGIAGKQADLLHPLAAKAKPFHRMSARTEQLLSIYLFAYIVVVIASLTQWGRLRRRMRSMLVRNPALAQRAPTPGVSPVASTSSTTPSASPSTTSLSPKSSRKRLGRRKSQQRRLSRRSLTPPDRKVEVPNVMRSSVVAPHNQIIPPLPRMSINEDTEDKISKLMKKFDSIDTVPNQLNQDSEESLVKGTKKA